MFKIVLQTAPKFLKNFLIFFPVLISNLKINNEIILKLCFGFIIFCFVTFVIYITNDYIDYKKDKSNILKKKNISRKYFSKEKIIYLNLSFLPLIAISFFFKLFSVYLILYIFSFYIYTFKAKFIKFADLIFLNSFYILRLFFGCDLIGAEISFWFVAFFSSFFLILSVFKRIIQIKVNRLKIKNKIISYSFKDYKLLKNSIIILILINSFVFLSYIFQSELVFLQSFSSKSTFVNFNIINYLFIFFIYIVNIVLLTKKIFTENINKDIFYYVIKDRLIIISLIIILLILFIK